MAEKKLSLSQKDFELFKESSLKDNLVKRRFADVTLACNDDKQVDAHRIILSAQSLFFRRIFEVNNRRDILIYLHNISSSEMENMLEFLYFGQAEVNESVFEKFIALGKIFEIKVFTDLELNSSNDPESMTETLLGAGYEGDNLLINKSLLKRQPNGKYPCDQCDYQSVVRSGVRRHQERVHLGIKYSCDECTKKYGDPYDLRIHKQSAHEGVFYKCEQCGKTFPQHKTLLLHEREHQGIDTKCTQCEKSFQSTFALNYHVNKLHDGLKHVCDLCDFRTNRIYRLKEHKGLVHN